MAGDNLHKSMRSVVIDTGNYDWEGDQPLRHPMSETIVYEMHVGGFTKSPTSGVANPGTYLGLIEKIPYLKSLGITAVELLRVCSFDHTDVMKVHEGRKLVNYWGYSTMLTRGTASTETQANISMNSEIWSKPFTRLASK